MSTAMHTLTGVRCPYCVSGDEFRSMVAHLDGRFVCAKCGHLANPCDRDFKCFCVECSRLRALKYPIRYF
jgi:ribosomal protein S27AE